MGPSLWKIHVALPPTQRTLLCSGRSHGYEATRWAALRVAFSVALRNKSPQWISATNIPSHFPINPISCKISTESCRHVLTNARGPPCIVNYCNSHSHRERSWVHGSLGPKDLTLRVPYPMMYDFITRLQSDVVSCCLHARMAYHSLQSWRRRWRVLVLRAQNFLWWASDVSPELGFWGFGTFPEIFRS